MPGARTATRGRSEEHTSELQSRFDLVCRLLLEKSGSPLDLHSFPTRRSSDLDLPEIPGRLHWEKPTSYLVKDAAAPTGWRVDDSSRRPSRLLLVPKIRAAVDAWRKDGYAGEIGRAHV